MLAVVGGTAGEGGGKGAEGGGGGSCETSGYAEDSHCVGWWMGEMELYRL